MQSKPSSQKPKVVVDRRRKPSPEQAAGQPRPAAPQRKTPRAQPPSTYTPSSSDGGYSQAGGTGGLQLGTLLPLLKRLPWWAWICLILGFVAFMLLSGGGGGLLSGGQVEEPSEGEVVSAPVATSRPTATRPAVQPVVGTGGEGTWLVMLYQDADDKILEQDIYLDLNEAEQVGSNESITIVAQVDRFSAGFSGDGNWTSARRYFITQDDDLKTVNSQVVEDLGEVNMSDAATLVDFVTWAVSSYPAEHHVLILSDHGMGWPGGWSDSAPKASDSSNALAARIGDQIYLNELDQALDEIRAQTGIGQFDLIGMDACLMGHLEVFTALAPHAEVAVASQETEPALGWAYTGFLSDLAANPGMDSVTLGQVIVDSYIEEDQRIVDDAERAEFLKQGSPLGGLFSFLGSSSAKQVAQQLEASITLAAADLSKLAALNSRVNELAYVLQTVDQKQVAQARSYAQSFTSVFGKDVPASYIDLGNFAALLQQESSNSGVDLAVQEVLAALDQVIVAEKHGSKKPGATGLSVYFPNAQLYANATAGAKTYAQIAESFARQSLWDDFLGYHYSGRSFELTDAAVVAVEPEKVTIQPGTGQVSITNFNISPTEASPGNPAVINADIDGLNIGHIKLFVGFYDEASNSLFVMDMDYLESSETRELDGVYYPVWPEQAFNLEYAWEPYIFAISDGNSQVVALFNPESYGATWEQAVYTVDGWYTYAEGGETLYARLYFSNSVLTNVYGFTGDNGTGAPREIIPTQGDQFTVLETLWELDAEGQVTQSITQEGNTLTFGEYMFTWESFYAPQGNYVIGVVVEDLEGNSFTSLGQVVVK